MTEIKVSDLMSTLHRWYMENGTDRSIDYTYGFFDAMGVIRDLSGFLYNSDCIIISKEDN